MTRCVPPHRKALPQTGWTPYAHTLTGLHLLQMPWVTPGPGPGISSERPSAHRGAQPLPQESGPSLMAPPLLWTSGIDSGPGSRTSKRTQAAPVAPGAYQPWTPSYRWECQGHLPGVAASRKLPLCPSETPPPRPANMWKSLLPPQPSHCPELAHTSLPNMPRPLKTPLGWGLPRPRGLVRRPELWGC